MQVFFTLAGCLPFSADSCIRVLSAFVEAFVRKDSDAVVIQWEVDSAFRFFPRLRLSSGAVPLDSYR